MIEEVLGSTLQGNAGRIYGKVSTEPKSRKGMADTGFPKRIADFTIVSSKTHVRLLPRNYEVSYRRSSS